MCKQVEIFKTNVADRVQAAGLLSLLAEQFPMLRINFDLSDCDRILRVEGQEIANDLIIDLVTMRGYYCRLLE